MTLSRWSAVATGVVSGATVIASLVALAWVYQWAVSNHSAADSEHKRLIIAAMIACALFAALTVLAGAIDAAGRIAPLAALTAAALGAFVSVAASAAATLLIAMAISPATDPGDFGRSLFRVAYVGAVVLSLCAGFAAAWTASAHHRRRVAGTATVLLMVVLVAAAWAYLAIGSSELNQCVVDDEFPLATNHVCSGY